MALLRLHHLEDEVRYLVLWFPLNTYDGLLPRGHSGVNQAASWLLAGQLTGRILGQLRVNRSQSDFKPYCAGFYVSSLLEHSPVLTTHGLVSKRNSQSPLLASLGFLGLC